MYARVTTFKVDPARLPELSEKIEELSRVAKALPGIVDLFAMWRADGQGTVVAIYRSKAAADLAVARVQGVWAAVAGLLSAAPVTHVYESVAHLTGSEPG